MLLNRIVWQATRHKATKQGADSAFTGAKLIALGSGVCGVGGLAYSIKHALSPQDDALINKVAIWPKYVKDRINGTFGYCLGGIGVTTVGAAAALRSQTLMRFFGSGSMMSFFGALALMMGSGMACRAVPFDGSPVGMKASLYYLHMGIVGMVISPICMLGGPIVLRAAAGTACVMAGLATTAMVAPSDAYLKTYGFVNVGCWLMLGACAASFFPMAPGVQMGMMSFILLGGLVLFAAKGFVDIQHCVTAAQQPGNYDPVNHSLAITMDAINIFIRLAQILAMGGGKRK